MIRIAIEKETQRQYIVQRLDIPKNGPVTVHCWGEVIIVRRAKHGHRNLHDGFISFPKEAVEIKEIEDTNEFREKLLDQGLKWLLARGYQVWRSNRTGNWKWQPPQPLTTPKQCLSRAETAERLGYQKVAEEFFNKAIELEEQEG